MPNPNDNHADTPGGQPPEPVEERPNVGTVKPEDYPLKDRAGGPSDAPLDEEKEHERLNPGDSRTPAVPGKTEEHNA